MLTSCTPCCAAAFSPTSLFYRSLDQTSAKGIFSLRHANMHNKGPQLTWKNLLWGDFCTHNVTYKFIPLSAFLSPPSCHFENFFAFFTSLRGPFPHFAFEKGRGFQNSASSFFSISRPTPNQSRSLSPPLSCVSISPAALEKESLKI